MHLVIYVIGLKFFSVDLDNQFKQKRQEKQLIMNDNDPKWSSPEKKRRTKLQINIIYPKPWSLLLL